VAALVAGVDIQAERSHVRHHLRAARSTQNFGNGSIAGPNLIANYKNEGAQPSLWSGSLMI
jgi:hypothetical protein